MKSDNSSALTQKPLPQQKPDTSLVFEMLTPSEIEWLRQTKTITTYPQADCKIEVPQIRLNRPGKQNSTAHREITDIQAILNWAVSRKLISHNPLAGYKKPRPDSLIVAPPTLKQGVKL